MRRAILLVVILLLAVAGGAFWWWSRPLPVLAVVTWSGTYGRAQAAAQIVPYGAAKRVDARIAQWDGKIDDVRQAVARRQYSGDVIDFELPVAAQACREGLLETLDPAALPAGDDGAAAKADFLPGAIGPCWVASIAYSQQIIFQAQPGWHGLPDKAADFFDLAAYPGARALARGNGKYVLELALLADGVPPGDVYRTLTGDAGLTRALAKLDTLKGHIVWLASAGEAIEAVHDGRAAFALVNSGDIAASHGRGFTPGVMTSPQFVEFDVFGVPKGDPKARQAKDFIAFATGTKPLAQVADWFPSSPARRSAWPLVGHNPTTGADMRPAMPVTKENADGAFAIDDTWWAEHGAAVEQRFRAWADRP